MLELSTFAIAGSLRAHRVSQRGTLLMAGLRLGMVSLRKARTTGACSRGAGPGCLGPGRICRHRPTSARRTVEGCLGRVALGHGPRPWVNPSPNDFPGGHP